MHIKIILGNVHHNRNLSDFRLFHAGQFDESIDTDEDVEMKKGKVTQDLVMNEVEMLSVDKNHRDHPTKSNSDEIQSQGVGQQESIKMIKVRDTASNEVFGPRSGIEKDNISQPQVSQTCTKTLKSEMGKGKMNEKKGVSLCRKRCRQDNEECDSQWNLSFVSGSGGAQAKTLIKYAEDEALDGMLQRHTKKSTIPKVLDLVMCKNMVPGNFPLAKWPIKDYAKELKHMHSLKEFSLKYSPNKKGIIHPYVGFSSIKIPANEFDEYVAKEFFSCDLPSKGFLKFGSSIGISKLQILVNDEATVILTFSPKGWNRCGHRLGSGHCLKPEINACKCDLECCRGKWSDEEWLAVLDQYKKSK